jgi:hypothetical protein
MESASVRRQLPSRRREQVKDWAGAATEEFVGGYDLRHITCAVCCRSAPLLSTADLRGTPALPRLACARRPVLCRL